MRQLYLIMIVIGWQPVLAQIPIKLTATGHAAAKSLTFDQDIRQTINPEGTYQLEVSGVNSAHTSLKVIAKSKEIVTLLPDALKTILPGITGSMKSQENFMESNHTTFQSVVRKKIDNLNFIKERADKLHSETLFAPDINKAKAAFAAVLAKYPSGTPEAKLTELVAADIQFLVAVKAIVDNILKNKPDLDLANFYADLITIEAELKKNDYQAAFDYIDQSRTAKNTVTSKVFSGSKDLLELTIILVDTYTKDTLANETRALYTIGGKTIGLSFSTGFFFTDMFSDTPYYLQSRADEKVAVLADKRIKADISIGALAHIYYKIDPLVRIGPALGVAVSPFDGKSRYLIGLSVLVGKEKMLGLTVGNAWGKVKELSAAVSTDGQGQYLPKGTTEVPTYDTINHGWFFGLTYNLMSTRK